MSEQQEQQGQVVDDFEATQEEVDNALTIKEVAKRTGLSDVYIRRRITTGKWHSFLDAKGRRRLLVREVEAWEAWRKAADAKAIARKVSAKEKAEAKAVLAAKAVTDAEAVAEAEADPSGIAVDL